MSPCKTVNPRSMQWATQCLVDVDTGADRIFAGFQIVEQRTVSASQPQYPCPLRNPGGHQPKIVANAVTGVTCRCHRLKILS
jgi:hypothetical protein